MSRFIKVKNIKLYKRRAVAIFTAWYVAIFNSLSSCTSEMEGRKEKKQEKDFEAIVKETETMLEQSRKIAYGELTGNEPWILPSARIGGLHTRRIIEAGKDIARKAIKEQKKQQETEQETENKRQKIINQNLMKALKKQLKNSKIVVERWLICSS